MDTLKQKSIKYVETDSEFYGKVIYNEEGMPICPICASDGTNKHGKTKGYKKLLGHVWQMHGVSADEYKEMYGLDKNKGILCEETRKKHRENVINNYEKVVADNLLKKGQKSRFKENNKGRTKEQVSEETRMMLANRLAKARKKKSHCKDDKQNVSCETFY